MQIVCVHMCGEREREIKEGKTPISEGTALQVHALIISSSLSLSPVSPCSSLSFTLLPRCPF